eukprot:GEMP01054968.1.p1 GENE.GEMP01054968.1~~GEMP01054968.1.p1  ORF type:complete len:272 (+),score=54.20 GEMP01054968.1:166-981(+)
MAWKSAVGILESKVRYWHSRDARADTSSKAIAVWEKGSMFALVDTEGGDFWSEMKPADLIAKHLFPAISSIFAERLHGKDIQGGFIIQEDNAPNAGTANEKARGPAGIVEAWSYSLVQGFFDVQRHLKIRMNCKFGAIFLVPVKSGLYCASRGDIGECFLGTAESYEKVSCESGMNWEVLPTVSHTEWNGEEQFVICATNNLWKVMTTEEAFVLCAEESKPAETITTLARDRGASDSVVLVLCVPQDANWPAHRELFKYRKVRRKDLFVTT